MPPLPPAAAAGLHGSILRAGALWLLGVCGAELQAAPWAEAFGLAVQHVGHADIVVSEQEGEGARGVPACVCCARTLCPFRLHRLTAPCMWLRFSPGTVPAPICPHLPPPPPLQVALMAVSALTVLLSNCLEESQFVAQPPGRRRLVLEGPLGAARGGSDSEDEAAGGWVGGWARG